jgi:hypothetical protein
VTVENCDKLALGEMLKSPQSGTARIVFSLTDMDIANPVGQLMLAPIINGVQKVVPGLTGTGEQSEVFQGFIKDAVITVANGKATQDVTLELIDPGVASDVVGSAQKPKAVYMPLTFKGSIDLATLKQELDLRVPPQLVSKFIPDRDWKKGFNDAFPQGIPGVVRGTTSAPKFEYGDVVFTALRSIGEKQLLKNIPGLGGNKAAGDGKNGATGGNANNPLGGILDQITGQKNANPPPQQPDSSQPPPAKKKKK